MAQTESHQLNGHTARPPPCSYSLHLQGFDIHHFVQPHSTPKEGPVNPPLWSGGKLRPRLNKCPNLPQQKDTPDLGVTRDKGHPLFSSRHRIPLRVAVCSSGPGLAPSQTQSHCPQAALRFLPYEALGKYRALWEESPSPPGILSVTSFLGSFLHPSEPQFPHLEGECKPCSPCSTFSETQGLIDSAHTRQRHR